MATNHGAIWMKATTKKPRKRIVQRSFLALVPESPEAESDEDDDELLE